MSTITEMEPVVILRVSAEEIDEFDRHYDSELFTFHGGDEVHTVSNARGTRFRVEVYGSEDAAQYVADLCGLDEFALEEA